MKDAMDLPTDMMDITLVQDKIGVPTSHHYGSSIVCYCSKKSAPQKLG
jgi:hypothetical protein